MNCFCLSAFSNEAIVRLFQARRNTDTTQKQRILEAATAVAEVVQQHLQERECGGCYPCFSFGLLVCSYFNR